MADYDRIFGKEDGVALEKTNGESSSPFVLYKKRWFILAMFVLTCTMLNMQWNEYSVISDIIMSYYDVSNVAVNWTSIVCFILYIPTAIPGSALLQKYGLRVGTLTATGLSCAAAWIKVFSVHKDRFWVVLLGQTVLAFSFLCILQSPPVVAAVWFGAEEISTACSIGVFGSLIGVAVGYSLPSVMVVKDNDEDAIAKNLFILSLTVAALNTAIFIIELIFFGDKPPSSPSGSQSRRIDIPLEWKTLAASYKNLLKNSTYLGLMTLFAIDYGVQNSYFVCLNQMLLLYYPDASVESGRVGALIIVSGIISIAANGVLLDKFHQFKSHFLVLQVLGAVAMVGFTHTLGQQVYIIYLLSVLLGILWMPTVPTCIEAMVESTYPESEGLVIANAYLVGSLSSTIGIFAFSALIEYLSALWANYVMIFLYLFGLLVLICTNFRYNRYEINFT